uniref:Uncharacterized protein n=1 Tax=Glossina pallidipes TaxID=7398 RepID=A0A1B0AJG8_GLOPL
MWQKDLAAVNPSVYACLSAKPRKEGKQYTNNHVVDNDDDGLLCWLDMLPCGTLKIVPKSIASVMRFFVSSKCIKFTPSVVLV